MINFQKLQDDNHKIKVIEDRWKINLEEEVNDLLVSKLEKYGVDFIWQDDILIPTNLTYIGGDGFSSIYSINSNDEIVIKVTNESSEIKFAVELINLQKENSDYKKYFVKTQVLIPSVVKTENYTEDYYKNDNVYIILEKLKPLNENELKLLDDLENCFIEIKNTIIFGNDDSFEEFDEHLFQQILEEFNYSNFEFNSEEFNFIESFGEFYVNVIEYIIENNWYDFNPKNIMLDNNGNFKIIDLQKRN